MQISCNLQQAKFDWQPFREASRNTQDYDMYCDIAPHLVSLIVMYILI